MYDIIDLNSKLVADLRQIAKDLNIPKTDKLLKKDLVYKILDYQALNPTTEMLKKESQSQTARHSRSRKPESKKTSDSKNTSKEPIKDSVSSDNKNEVKPERKRPERRERPKKSPVASADKTEKQNPDLTVMEDETISIKQQSKGRDEKQAIR